MKISEGQSQTTLPTEAEMDELLGKPGPAIEVDAASIAACVEASRQEARPQTTDFTIPVVDRLRPWVENLAVHIADTVFPYPKDVEERDRLEILLIEFANEIRRSAIEL